MSEERKQPEGLSSFNPELPVLVGSGNDQWLVYKGKVNHVDDIAAVMDVASNAEIPDLSAASVSYEVGLLNNNYTVLKRNHNGVYLFHAQTGDDKAAAINLAKLLNEQGLKNRARS